MQKMTVGYIQFYEITAHDEMHEADAALAYAFDQYVYRRLQINHEVGTLFLDEIGDMPLNLQARLLRVLQERCVTPLGSTRAIQVDISLVCATHRKLREEVARGTFREDLYYRLNGLSVTLPPLRDRTDIRAMVYKLASSFPAIEPWLASTPTPLYPLTSSCTSNRG